VPIHRYTEDHPIVLGTFASRLRAEYSRQVGELVSVTSWEDLLRRQGELQGLKTAQDLLEQVDKEVRGG
jgi:hypothetical protein